MIISNIKNKHMYIHNLKKLIKILVKTPTSDTISKKLTLFSNKKNTFNINHNIINYVINIISFPSNTFVNVTDVRGKVIVSVSEGLVDISKSSKKSQSSSVLKLFKSLLVKSNFLKNKPVTINFKNVKRYQEVLFLKILQSKMFIKSVQSFTNLPHNGCRPKKLKRIKLRTKRLVIK